MKKEGCVLKWSPTIVSLALAAATLIIYGIIYDERSVQIYLQVSAAAFVPAAFPLIGKITKKDFPICVGVLATTHIFLANDLGSALGFYGLIPSWDLIMHGFFGLVFAVIAKEFMLRWGCGAMKKGGFYLLIFLSTAGAAAMWEIWEFICDIVLDGDAQRVKEAIANGTNPVADTMTDIMITLAGVAVFYIVIFIAKLRGYDLGAKKSGKTESKSENDRRKG